MKAQDKLIAIYQEMAEMTAPICANECRCPHSCCSPEYCNMAIEYAAEQGITLVPTDHPNLPMMGTTGCIAPPHLRPICTVHVCCINGIGFRPGEPEWTKKYFKLRSMIERAEYKKSNLLHHILSK